MTALPRSVRSTPLLLLLLLVVGCTSYPDRDPTLADFQQAVAADEAEAAGGWLMSRPEGVRTLDARSTPAITVAVHGFGSRGKEWVGPLARLDAPGTRFYRWDWMTCPDDAVAGLAAALAPVLAEAQSVRIVGHSYGGLITALFARRYGGTTPVEAHVVAAPLAGTPKLNALCGDVKPGAAGDGAATIKQWRTVHAQDGAFRDIDPDPQVVDWAGDDVVTLPAEWEGGRLGHNRSLQWVAEQLGRGGVGGEPGAQP